MATFAKLSLALLSAGAFMGPVGFLRLVAADGDAPVPVAPPNPIVEEVGSQLMDPEEPFMMVVSFKAKPTESENILGLMEEALDESPDEDGNIQYTLVQSVSDPTDFVLIEQWEDLEALADHMDEQYIIDMLAGVEPLLDGGFDIKVMVPKTGPAPTPEPAEDDEDDAADAPGPGVDDDA